MGDWNPPTGTTLYWTAGMSYIAYYPYKEDVAIDATQIRMRLLLHWLRTNFCNR